MQLDRKFITKCCQQKTFGRGKIYILFKVQSIIKVVIVFLCWFLSKFQLKHVKRATSFLDLNFDCQLSICENMHIFDLLSLTETNTAVFPAVENILRRKFTKKAVKYHGQQLDFQLKPTSFGILEFDDEIIFEYGATIRQILKYFGHLIINLEIVHFNKVPDIVARNFYQLINFHCADTLSQFHISLQNNDILAELKKPFKNVKNVFLDGYHKTSCNVAGHQQFVLSSLFPAVTVVELGEHEEQYLLLSEQIIPQLEELRAVCWGNIKPHLVQKLIRNHPTIRRLKLKYAGPEFLQYASKHLPHLDTLELEHFLNSDKDFAMHFEHLQRLNVKKTRKIIGNITEWFQGIEEFESDGSLRGRTEWIELVKSQKNLKKIVINAFLDETEIMDLANAELNVVEIQFECGPEVKIESFARLLEHSRKLEKLRLYSQDDHRALPIDLLRKQFDSEWIITRTPLYIDFHRLRWS